MNILLLTVTFAVCLISYSVAYPATGKVLETLVHLTGKEDARTNDGFEYMRKFGYLNRRPRAMTWPDYEVGVKKMQEKMALPQTGILDDVTYEQMHKPRCGNPDGHVYSLQDEQDWDEDREWEEGLYAGGRMKPGNSKRYVLTGGKWEWRDIWYKVTNYKSGMKEADFDRAVANAYNKWSAVTTLTFTPTKCTKIDFELYFGPATHGSPPCPDKFESDTLAHAMLPDGPIEEIYGDTHFNEALTWGVRPADDAAGIDMENVALHEFGHALGLDHSNVKAAVMFAFYDKVDALKGGTLKADDISAIRALYGDENTPYGKPKPLPTECIDTAKQY